MEAHEGAVTPGFDEDGDQVEPIEETEERHLSLADEIEADRERLSEEREPLDLPLPGYGKKLVARYKVLDGDTLKEIATDQRRMAQRRDPQAEFKMMCDTLAKACVGIFTTRDGELVPLEEAGEPELEGVTRPVRYDLNLAKLVRYPIDTVARFSARKLVRYLFLEDVALISHYNEIDTWMTSARGEDDEDF